MNTSPDFRALCAELVKAVDDASNAVDLISDCLNPSDFADQIKESCELIGKHDDLLIRAGAALAAKPQEPMDEELDALW